MKYIVSLGLGLLACSLSAQDREFKINKDGTELLFVLRSDQTFLMSPFFGSYAEKDGKLVFGDHKSSNFDVRYEYNKKAPAQVKLYFDPTLYSYVNGMTYFFYTDKGVEKRVALEDLVPNEYSKPATISLPRFSKFGIVQYGYNQKSGERYNFDVPKDVEKIHISSINMLLNSLKLDAEFLPDGNLQISEGGKDKMVFISNSNAAKASQDYIKASSIVEDVNLEFSENEIVETVTVDEVYPEESNTYTPISFTDLNAAKIHAKNNKSFVVVGVQLNPEQKTAFEETVKNNNGYNSIFTVESDTDQPSSFVFYETTAADASWIKKQHIKTPIVVLNSNGKIVASISELSTIDPYVLNYNLKPILDAQDVVTGVNQLVTDKKASSKDFVAFFVKPENTSVLTTLDLTDPDAGSDYGIKLPKVEEKALLNKYDALVQNLDKQKLDTSLLNFLKAALSSNHYLGNLLSEDGKKKLTASKKRVVSYLYTHYKEANALDAEALKIQEANDVNRLSYFTSLKELLLNESVENLYDENYVLTPNGVKNGLDGLGMYKKNVGVDSDFMQKYYEIFDLLADDEKAGYRQELIQTYAQFSNATYPSGANLIELLDRLYNEKFASRFEDWNDFKYSHALLMNNVAWQVFLEHKDRGTSKYLKEALQWSERSLKLRPQDHNNLDTYSQLLFVDGQKELASKIQSQANKLALEAGESVYTFAP